MENEYLAPRTPLEETLCQIEAEVLKVPRVGVHDDYMALGGNSLQAVRIAIRVVQECGVEVSARALFDYPTVEALAVHVEQLVDEALAAALEGEG